MKTDFGEEIHEITWWYLSDQEEGGKVNKTATRFKFKMW